MLIGYSLGLPSQRGVECGHGSTNFGSVTARISGIQGFRGFDHRQVVGAKLGSRGLALCAFALESFVQRCTENFPQLLFCLAIDRHRLGFNLPALLQSLNSVHTQVGCSTQFTGFIDQGMTALDTGFLCGLQWGSGSFEDAFPLRLHFAKGLFAQMTRIAPAVCKLMQRAQLAAPVAVFSVGCRPGFDLFHQGQTLSAVIGRFFFNLL